MSAKKHRLTVTVDPALFEAGQRAVAAGAADSVSGWVSSALEDKVRRDEQLRLLGAAIADYEAEHGDITAEEIAAQARLDREQATVVRPKRRGSKAKTA